MTHLTFSMIYFPLLKVFPLGCPNTLLKKFPSGQELLRPDRFSAKSHQIINLLYFCNLSNGSIIYFVPLFCPFILILIPERSYVKCGDQTPLTHLGFEYALKLDCNYYY